MRISDIKYKADEILLQSKDVLVRTFIFMGIISLVVSTVRGLFVGEVVEGILWLLITIVFLPFEHGYIVSSMKAVNNRENEIIMEEDGLVGFKRFKELFGTYFIYNVFMFVIVFIFILVMIFVVIFSLPSYAFTELGTAFSQTLTYGSFSSTISDATIAAIGSAVMLFLLLTLVMVVILVYYYLNFALTPYILEKYKITGVEALKESARLMKGYKSTLFSLSLSFLGWMILDMIILYILALIIPFGFVVSAIGVVTSVFLYRTKLQVSLAILYEEIDLARDVRDTEGVM